MITKDLTPHQRYSRVVFVGWKVLVNMTTLGENFHQPLLLFAVCGSISVGALTHVREKGRVGEADQLNLHE